MERYIINNRLVEIDANKIRKMMTAILCVVFSVFVAFASLSYAAGGVDDGGGGETTSQTGKSYEECINELDSANGKKQTLAKAAFQISVFTKGGLAKEISEFKVFNVSNSSIYKGFTGGYNLFKNVGIGLAVLWALASVISNIQIVHANLDIVIKFALKMMASVYVVSNGNTILDALLTFGDTALSKISGNITDNALYEELLTQCKNAGMLGCIGIIMENLVGCVVIMIACILILSKLITRLIELGVRYMLAPIAIADVFSHGGGSTGARYLKKFAAVALSGAVYMAVIKIMPLIAGAIGTQTGLVGSMVLPIVTYVAGLGMINRVDTIVNDLA